MANIKIYNLRPAGLELFSDSESYMKEMTEGELSGVLGGACEYGGVVGAAALGAGIGGTGTLFLGAAIGGVLGASLYTTYCLA